METTTGRSLAAGEKRGSKEPAAKSRVAPRAVSRLSPVRSRKSVLSREEYTLRSIERAFPSGEWVEVGVGGGDKRGLTTAHESSGSEAPSLSGPAGGSRPQNPPSITIIGGTKYDEDALAYWLYQNDGYEIVTGAGRGVEAALEGVIRIDLETDVYGKNARKVNVEAVLCHDPTSPLLLVGSGERVKQAEAWLKRANWGREVHRIG